MEAEEQLNESCIVQRVELEVVETDRIGNVWKIESTRFTYRLDVSCNRRHK